MPWIKGKHHTEEARKKMSEAHKGQIPWNKGKHLSEEVRRKLSEAHKGKPLTEEWKKRLEKLWEMKRGKHRPEDVRKKISESLKGRHRSEETKRKIGEALKRLWQNPEYRRRVSEYMSGAFKGRHHSEEARRKISESHKGRHLTEEWKRKISESHKREEIREKLREYRLKQVIPVRDTSIEVALQNGLRERGIAFETHKPIYGQPDIFIEPNICVFADGDYWHSLPHVIEKDARVNRVLTEQGYKVLRFWEHEINSNLDRCLDAIEREVAISREPVLIQPLSLMTQQIKEV
jgi:very-short-patch-repair endonuclease